MMFGRSGAAGLADSEVSAAATPAASRSSKQRAIIACGANGEFLTTPP
jgi:hypothetical protein